MAKMPERNLVRQKCTAESHFSQRRPAKSHFERFIFLFFFSLVLLSSVSVLSRLCVLLHWNHLSKKKKK